MNQQNNPPVGIPGAGRSNARAAANSPETAEGPDSSETDRLLGGVEQDAERLDGLSTKDQVPHYDRMHTALADALARTADTGAPPGPGHAGA